MQMYVKETKGEDCGHLLSSYYGGPQEYRSPRHPTGEAFLCLALFYTWRRHHNFQKLLIERNGKGVCRVENVRGYRELGRGQIEGIALDSKRERAYVCVRGKFLCIDIENLFLFGTYKNGKEKFEILSISLYLLKFLTMCLFGKCINFKFIYQKNWPIKNR